MTFAKIYFVNKNLFTIEIVSNYVFFIVNLAIIYYYIK